VTARPRSSVQGLAAPDNVVSNGRTAGEDSGAKPTSILAFLMRPHFRLTRRAVKTRNRPGGRYAPRM